MPALVRASALALLATSEGARVSRHRKWDGYNIYEGKPLLELSPCKAFEVEELNAALARLQCRILDDDFSLPRDGGCADSQAVCDVDGAHIVEAQFPGIVDVVSTDAAAYFRKTSGSAMGYVARAGEPFSSDFYSNWRGYTARMDRVEQIVASSGGVARIETAGNSHEGRPIRMVRFTGSGYSPGKPKAVFTFNLHAREWIGGMAGVYALEKFTDLVKQNRSVISGMEVVMIPMANPDGFIWSETQDRFHRKNTNGAEPGAWWCKGGVDLNRNFDSAWGTVGSSGNPCQETFHGTSAGSEKETQVLKQVMQETPMTVFIDVHAYTQLILWSWGYTRANHPRSSEFEQLGLAMKRAVEGKHRQRYTAGAIAQTLYAAAGGIEDYATTLGALGYTYELRPRTNQGLNGFAPPADQILPSSEECYEGLLTAVNYARTR